MLREEHLFFSALNSMGVMLKCSLIQEIHSMKVMIAAGGTGGHIYPALALADRMKEKLPDCEISFFGSLDRMESDLIPSSGYTFFGYDVATTQGGILQKVKSLLSMIRAQGYCKKLLKQEKIDICIGFGNYISIPLINAAHSLRIPTLLHEQNSTAGKANVYLGKKADAVAISYESSRSQFPDKVTRLTGNPEASLAADTVYDPDEIRTLGLNPDIPFILFMMGSLGSSTVSSVIDAALPLLDNEYQVVVAAGKQNSHTFTTKSDDRMKIVPYVNGKNLLKGCALAITRAGATTMAELSAVGCASVLIPSPYVPNNHQVYNAMDLVKENAAVMIEEKDLDAKVLADTINTLMKDPEKLAEMKKNAKAAGHVEAADSMIEWCLELIKK